MRNLNVTDRHWTQLLSIREGKNILRREEANPTFSLYGPIASAKGRFVLAQVGQSLDGRVATPTGDARDISGPDGLVHLHRCRALVDAVIVGVGTVQNDNPRLSVREVKGPSPVRVVIDCRSELTGAEGMFHDGGAPVIIFQGDDALKLDYPADVISLKRGPNGLAPPGYSRLSRRARIKTRTRRGWRKNNRPFHRRQPHRPSPRRYFTFDNWVRAMRHIPGANCGTL